MPNVFTAIGTAWEFYRTQPVLNLVLLWLLVLPITGLMALASQRQDSLLMRNVLPQVFQSDANNMGLFILLICLELMLSIITLWGAACTLLVGKKLISSKAGRSRSSLQAVSKDASKFVVNMFLTDILRSCFMIFWSLLLIVPGIIYFLRTFFFYIAIVCEGQAYRGALDYSKKLVTGHTWEVLWFVLGLCITLFVPAVILDGSVYLAIEAFDTQLLPITFLVGGTCYGLATLIFLLSTQVYYTALKKA